MRSIFRSLHSRNFRAWFFAGIISNVGTWVQSTATNWYILTDLTDGDATAVGLALSLQFVPQLLLVPLTGWLPDRFDRKKLLVTTNALMFVLVLTLGATILSGGMTLPIMYAFSAMFGVLSACDIPARQTFVTDLVQQEDLSNAVALNSASYNLGRMMGPAIAGGLLVAVGAGWAFVANAASYLALLIALMAMRRSEFSPRAALTGVPRVWGGVIYLRKRPDVIFVCVFIFVIAALTINLPLTSSFMVAYFQSDAAAFGAINSVAAIGSLVGALVAARNHDARLTTLVIAGAVLALAAAASALAPNIIWYGVTLVFAGFAVILALSTANGYVQSTTPAVVRGRVVAAYMAVMMGGSTLGSPLLGMIADAWGARWAIGIGAIATAFLVVAGSIWLRSRPRFDT